MPLRVLKAGDVREVPVKFHRPDGYSSQAERGLTPLVGPGRAVGLRHAGAAGGRCGCRNDSVRVDWGSCILPIQA